MLSRETRIIDLRSFLLKQTVFYATIVYIKLKYNNNSFWEEKNVGGGQIHIFLPEKNSRNLINAFDNVTITSKSAQIQTVTF